MKVRGEDLMPCLALTEMISARSGVLSSRNYRIDARPGGVRFRLCGEVFGEFEVSSDCDSKAQFTADRSSLSAFISALNRSKDITLTFKDSRLLASQARRRATFSLVQGVTGYGSAKGLDRGKPWKLAAEEKEALALCSRYASEDPVIPQYNCVYVAKGRGAFATDSYCFLHVPFATPPARSYAFPVFLPTILSKLTDEAKIKVSRSGASVSDEGVYFYQPTNLKAFRFPVTKVSAMLKAPAAPVVRIRLSRFQRGLSLFKSVATSGEGQVVIKCVAGSKRVVLLMRSPFATFEDKVYAVAPADVSRELTLYLPKLSPLIESQKDSMVLSVFENDAFLKCTLPKGEVFVQSKIHGK